MDALEAMATTRAIRRYRPEPIADDDLGRILWHATRAPSGSNRQPFRFLVLRDGPHAREARSLLGRGFRAAWADKRAADGYERGSGVDSSSPKARMAAAMVHFVDHIEDVPAIVLAGYGRHRAVDPHEGASVYPACQNLLLAARALGYGGVLTMWHAGVDGELRDLLAIPDHVVIAATVAIGKPEGNHGPVRRRPVNELVFDGGWGYAGAWATEPPGTRHTGRPPPTRAGG